MHASGVGGADVSTAFPADREQRCNGIELLAMRC
jgi:hypothetical protein